MKKKLFFCSKNLKKNISGGETGIRTQERVAPLPVFKTGAFNRSAISPFASFYKYIFKIQLKIKYRSKYRGTKEMDLFIEKFVNYSIEKLNLIQLQDLNYLINLNDEEIIKISNEEFKLNENKAILLLKEFKKKY